MDVNGLPNPTDYVKGGNIAICHWLYFRGLSDYTRPTKDGTQNTDWGETRYFSTGQWGPGGSNISGADIQTAGIKLTSTVNGFKLNSVSLSTYANEGDYSMQWYQPKYQSYYPTGTLRRYNGLKGYSDNVRAFCVSARNLSSIGFFGVSAADKTGVNGVVSLSGATTVALSAIAYGVAALAF